MALGGTKCLQHPVLYILFFVKERPLKAEPRGKGGVLYVGANLAQHLKENILNFFSAALPRPRSGFHQQVIDLLATAQNEVSAEQRFAEIQSQAGIFDHPAIQPDAATLHQLPRFAR